MDGYFIPGVTFAFAAAVQPGPLQSYLITQTLTHGWRRTILASFSPLISDIPIISLSLLLLTHLPPYWIQVIQFIGGIYLLYLTYIAFKAFRSVTINQVALSHTPEKTLLKAVFVNLLNPNPYLGWSLVMGPLLLKAWHEGPANGILFLVSFYSTLVISLFATIMLISITKRFGSQMNRILLGISVFALGFFGIYEIALGISSLF